MESKTKTDEKPASDSMEDERPLLDLSTPLERAVILGPDGNPYELRTAEEFSVEDEHLLRAEMELFSELQGRKTLKGEDRAKLRLRLHKIFDRIIDAPDAVRVLFNDRQRQKVLMVFRTRWAREDAETIRGAIKDLELPESEDGSTTES